MRDDYKAIISTIVAISYKKETLAYIKILELYVFAKMCYHFDIFYNKNRDSGGKNL